MTISPRWLRAGLTGSWRQQRQQPLLLIEQLAAPVDNLLQLLMIEAASGIAVINRQGRVIRVNNALRRMLEAHGNVESGDPLESIFCKDQESEILDQLRPVFSGKCETCVCTTTLRSLTGSAQKTVEVSAVAVREADGTTSGAVLQLKDITTQKRLEAQLTQGQKLQAVGQLAGGIAHDFNNLLTAMLGAADDALSRTPTDTETIYDLKQIRASAERGAALVRQLLAFGRQQTLQPQAVSINEAVVCISELLRRLLGSAIRLDLQLEQPDRTIRVDPTQLDQVLVNLAVNARDAMADGGQLTLRTGHMTLYRSLVRGEETIPPGRYVMIEIQDTGTGIPPDVLPRIFDPFFTTRRERGGSGLGLSTVHGIVRQSDGFLAVESVVGTGTRIKVYLPRFDGEQVAIPKPPITVTPHVLATSLSAVRTVLLVDDEDGVRRLAERALVKSGWKVASAASGEAALALLERRSPALLIDIIVSDVIMPGMDGPTLVKAVRTQYPQLPALLVSGYAEDLVQGEMRSDDFNFLAKPYTLKALVAQIDQIHASSRLRSHFTE